MQETISDNRRLNPCSECGHNNPIGVLVCESCGSMISGDKAGTTYHLGEDAIQLDDVQEPAVRQVNLNDRKMHFPAGATFAIKMREMDDPMVYQPNASDPLLMGRRNKQNEFVPDIDLYPFAGYLLGVSRRHALIYRDQNRLMLEDLGSSNGTFIDGTRMKPNEAQPLYDGVEVSLGKLHFTIHF